jgi:hypothetical protein
LSRRLAQETPLFSPGGLTANHITTRTGGTF